MKAVRGRAEVPARHASSSRGFWRTEWYATARTPNDRRQMRELLKRQLGNFLVRWIQGKNGFVYVVDDRLSERVSWHRRESHVAGGQGYQYNQPWTIVLTSKKRRLHFKLHMRRLWEVTRLLRTWHTFSCSLWRGWGGCSRCIRHWQQTRTTRLNTIESQCHPSRESPLYLPGIGQPSLKIDSLPLYNSKTCNRHLRTLQLGLTRRSETGRLMSDSRMSQKRNPASQPKPYRPSNTQCESRRIPVTTIIQPRAIIQEGEDSWKEKFT